MPRSSPPAAEPTTRADALSARAATLLGKAARAGGRWSHRLEHAVTARTPRAPGADEDDAAYVTGLFRDLLFREPDAGGLATYTEMLRTGTSRDRVYEILSGSPEHGTAKLGHAVLESFHGGRVQWARSLPPARRILDLGGTSLGNPLGSLLLMGYPYEFDDITIVELPSEERHALYHDEQSAGVDSGRGQVKYLWRSMVDLGDIPDGSVDLIVSAQTFEHITEAEGAEVLTHVRRLLSPGGALALDTPNRAVSAIECEHTGNEWINPDHKIEYTHEQMMAAFDAADLRVDIAFGIGLMPETVRTRRWISEELVTYPGLFADIRRCYTLAYLARAR